MAVKPFAYQDIFTAELLDRFHALDDLEQRVIFEAVIRDHHVAVRPIIPVKYIKMTAADNVPGGSAIVHASTFYNGRNRFMRKPEFVAVLREVKRAVWIYITAPTFEQLQTSRRAEGVRRDSAEKAARMAVKLMEDPDTSARERLAAARWLYEGRGVVDTEKASEAETTYMADQWDGASGGADDTTG